MEEKIKNGGLKKLGFLFLYSSIAIILVAYLFLAQKGIEIVESTLSLTFFGFMATGAVMGIIMLVIFNYIYRTPLLLHNPEWSLLNALGLKLKIFQNGFMFLFFSIIVSFWIAFVGLIKMGMPFTLQEATMFTKLVYGVEPAVIIETLSFTIIFNIFMVIAYLVVKKYKLPKAIFWLLLIPVIILLTFAGMNYHNYAHQQQVDLKGNFGFWFGVCFSLTMFASIIFPICLHFWNNLFMKMYELFAIDYVVVFLLIFGLIITMICIYYLVRIYLKSEKQPEVEVKWS